MFNTFCKDSDNLTTLKWKSLNCNAEQYKYRDISVLKFKTGVQCLDSPVSKDLKIN